LGHKLECLLSVAFAVRSWCHWCCCCCYSCC